jgi:hypothetical protein
MPFGDQWRTPHNCCVRFAAAVADGYGRGRDGDCSPPPAQIPACGFPAPGSCRGSNVIGLRGWSPIQRRSAGQRLVLHANPARCPEHELPPSFPSAAPLPSTLSAPRTPRLIPGSSRFCSSASSVLRARPTPRLFPDSFVSSTSCRGQGSPQRLLARRGLPSSDAVLSDVLWSPTPAERPHLAYRRGPYCLRRC